MVLLSAFLLYGVTGPMIDLTPRYYTYQNHPFINIDNNNVMSEILWPKCDQACDNPSFIKDPLIYQNLSQNLLNCKSSNGSSVEPPALTLPNYITAQNVSNADITGNGTFCSITFSGTDNASTNITCDVQKGFGDLLFCDMNVGQHMATFIVYVLLRAIFIISMNVAFSVMDGTAMRYCRIYNGEYAMCLFSQAFGGLVASFLGGLLVQDFADSNSKYLLSPHTKQFKLLFKWS